MNRSSSILIIAYALFFLTACINDKIPVNTNIHEDKTSDTLAPNVISVEINNGDKNTNSRNLLINIVAKDDTAVASFCISESETLPLDADNWINIETPNNELDLTVDYFTEVDGVGLHAKTIYVWLRDSAGNISQVNSASISIDIEDTQPPPATVSISIEEGAVETNHAQVSISLILEDSKKVTAYYISESSTNPKPNSTNWRSLPNTNLNNININYNLTPAVVPGEYQRIIYAWLLDENGNISEVGSSSIKLVIEDNLPPLPPHITIANNDSSTNQTNIQVSISSSDSDVVEYYLSESNIDPDANEINWQTFPISNLLTSFNLNGAPMAGEYERTLYAWLRDSAGNISGNGYDSITLIITDTSSPDSVNVVLNDGAGRTNSNEITLSLFATDDVGVSGYYVSESPLTPDTNNQRWSNIAPNESLSLFNIPFLLSAENEIGEHQKEVYVWFKDSSGNISNHAKDSIILNVTDTDAPTISSVEINQGDETTSDVDISLSVSSSDNAGISGYYISENLVTPTLNSPGWLNSVENQINATHVLSNETSIGQHEKFVYVWSRDTAGNISSPGVDSITLLVNDIEPPQSAMALINQGAEITSDTNITISISASDNEGISAYYISEILSTPSQNTPGWTLSTLNSIDTSYTLSAETEIGTHEKTIYVWFRDAAGNISTVASDSINLSVNDTSPPNNTSIDAAGNTTETTQRLVAVNIAALDNYAVTHYFLSENPTTPALNAMWTSITPTADFSTTVSFELSDNFGSKTVYAWFKDAAGNISSSTQYTINYISDVTPIAPGTSWLFLGDSQTAGRTVNEPAAHSHGIAFQNIWNQTFISEQPDSVRTSGVGGRVLQKTHEKYLDMNFGTETWVHFQESGLQNSTQDTIVEYINEFEAMVRSIAQESPSAIISTETAYSFEEIVAERNWTDHNIAMRQSITGLANEGITVYLSEVDRNIKELISRKRAELGEKLGQEAVWGDTNNTIGRHYTGLGNVMIALSIYDALGYDLSILDFSLIPEQQVSNADILLCIDIINNI